MHRKFLGLTSYSTNQTLQIAAEHVVAFSHDPNRGGTLIHCVGSHTFAVKETVETVHPMMDNFLNNNPLRSS